MSGSAISRHAGGQKGNGALQSIFHVLWALAMQLPVGVFEHVISPHMHSHVLLPQAFVQSL